MNPPIWAGFECGFLEWCNQDLLIDTRHTPETDMRAHYVDAMARGVMTFRDGLPWRHDPAARVEAVPEGARVIWDLCHFDPPPSPAMHALTCVRSFGASPHVLAVNEPSIWPMLCGRSRDDAVRAAIEMMAVVIGTRTDPVFYTCDPIHHLHEEEFAATDALVATGWISVVGVNYYPHCAAAGLAEVLQAAARRYGLPVAITETGYHEGHPNNAHLTDMRTRACWMRHVFSEIERSGVEVVGVTGYPWLDMPAWGSPGTAERWPCGMSQALAA